MCALSLSPFMFLSFSMLFSSACLCKKVPQANAGGLNGSVCQWPGGWATLAADCIRLKERYRKELAFWNLSANFLSALNNQPPPYIFTWSQYTHANASLDYFLLLFLRRRVVFACVQQQHSLQSLCRLFLLPGPQSGDNFLACFCARQLVKHGPSACFSLRLTFATNDKAIKTRAGPVNQVAWKYESLLLVARAVKAQAVFG